MATWLIVLLCWAIPIIPFAIIFGGYVDERAYRQRGEPRSPEGLIWFLSIIWPVTILILAIASFPEIGRALYHAVLRRREERAAREIAIEAARRDLRAERAKTVKSAPFRRTRRKLELTDDR